MFDKQFKKYTGYYLFLIVIIFCLPVLFTRLHWFGLDFTRTGEIGDTLGGIMDPFIGIIAGALTFLAFWVQFKANEQQKDDLQVERFENKFYNLIEIHRNNINEISINQSDTRRKTFISMFSELKCTYLIVDQYYKGDYKNERPDDQIPESVVFNVAYLIFFFGVGESSSEMVADLLGDRYNGFFQNAETKIKEFQEIWRRGQANGQLISVNFKN